MISTGFSPYVTPPGLRAQVNVRTFGETPKGGGDEKPKEKTKEPKNTIVDEIVNTAAAASVAATFLDHQTNEMLRAIGHNPDKSQP